jgi:hypothetical protein
VHACAAQTADRPRAELISGRRYETGRPKARRSRSLRRDAARGDIGRLSGKMGGMRWTQPVEIPRPLANI